MSAALVGSLLGSGFLLPGAALIKRRSRGPLMRKIRYLDKLIDELAKGKAMEKILR